MKRQSERGRGRQAKTEAKEKESTQDKKTETEYVERGAALVKTGNLSYLLLITKRISFVAL